MKLSTDRILTTHVGSLPRPDDLLDLMEPREKGEDYDAAALEERTARAVDDIVAQQVDAGIDVVSDGEMSKLSYTFYVKHRLDGVGGDGAPGGETRNAAMSQEFIDHPDYHQRMKELGGNWFMRFSTPYCVGPVSYGDRRPLETDITNFRRAIGEAKPVEGFMNAASPGVLTKFIPDRHYNDEDAYVEALAHALKQEYEAIHAAGFLLQIDCPDLGSARHNQYRTLSEDAFLKIADRNVEALNYATQNIPPDAMRMHICWGNYEGPHTHDIPLATVFDICMKGRPAALLFEGANPRHAHEWEDLQDVKIPDGKVLIPGVIDSTTNFVEHPKLVAQRLCHYADLVGRERVIAGTDCGFSTFAGQHQRIATSIVWAKMRALAEGARIASDRLWT